MTWAPDYATSAEAKSYLRIGDTDDDTEIGLAITTASRAIDRATNRQFGLVAAAESRRYYPRWDRRRDLYVVEVDDVQTTTDMVVTDDDGDTVDELVTDGDGGYQLEPVNNPQKSRPWTQFTLESTTSEYFDVVAWWGWTSIPTPVNQGCLLQLSRVFSRRTSPYGVAGSPDLGSELRLLAKLDPDVKVAIGPYVRWWGAA